MHLIDALLKTLALWTTKGFGHQVRLSVVARQSHPRSLPRPGWTMLPMTTLATPPNFCHQVWMDIDLSEWVQQKQKWDAWNSSLSTDAGFKSIHKMSRVPLAISLGEASHPSLCWNALFATGTKRRVSSAGSSAPNQHFQKVSWELNCEFMTTHLNGTSWGMGEI